VFVELWLRFEPQIRSTRFAMNFLFIIATNERKFCFCVKLFDHFLTEYSSVYAKICRASSQNLLGFFHKISTRNSFGNFLETSYTLRRSSFQIYQIFPYFQQFYYEFILCWKVLKTLTQVLSYVICIHSRRHVQKENTKKYIRKKSLDVLFLEKQVFQFWFPSVRDLLRLIWYDPDP